VAFTTKEAEQVGARIIIFSLVLCVAAVHGKAIAQLEKTGTNHSSAKGMNPRAFFEAMGLEEVVEVDRRAGGTALSSIWGIEGASREICTGFGCQFN
jgi:hypothetical protein